MHKYFMNLETLNLRYASCLIRSINKSTFQVLLTVLVHY